MLHSGQAFHLQYSELIWNSQHQPAALWWKCPQTQSSVSVSIPTNDYLLIHLILFVLMQPSLFSSICSTFHSGNWLGHRIKKTVLWWTGSWGQWVSFHHKVPWQDMQTVCLILCKHCAGLWETWKHASAPEEEGHCGSEGMHRALYNHGDTRRTWSMVNVHSYDLQCQTTAFVNTCV